MAYHIAKGQEALETKIKELWEKSQTDAAVKKEPQDILYNLGQQFALIKVDFSKDPIKFWHDDFAFDRAAIMPIKNAILNFCKTQLDEEGKIDDAQILKKHFTDYSLEKLLKVNQDFRRGGKMNIEGPAKRELPDSQQANLKSATQDISPQLPNISTENIRALIQAQMEFKAATFAQKGNYPVKLFDRPIVVDDAPAAEQVQNKTFRK
jgi:hypothetical protein